MAFRERTPPPTPTEQTPLMATGTDANTSPSTHNNNIFFQRGTKPMLASRDSDDILAMRSKQKRRKNVGAFRRRRQDYASWKGRIGVHVHVDDFHLKKLTNVIFQTLSTDWEMVDLYDTIRLWQPVHNLVSGGEDNNVPSGGQEYLEGESEGQIDASMPEVFIFGFGAVVFWNFSGEEEEIKFMENHLLLHEDLVGLRHSRQSIENACDEMLFCYGDKFRWHRDVVQLQTRDASEKLAVSFAVAKSSTLAIYESKLESAIDRNHRIPEQMAVHGELHMTRKQVNVEIGRLFLLNNAINLETNMLDVPEEFWEDDRFEPEYTQSMKYLDVYNRIAIVDKRLAVLKDLHSILMDAAHNVHASHLEWIIIILIVVEILIEVFRAWREMD